MAQRAGSATTLRRSVVICTYANERWPLLVKAVESVEPQLGDHDELILVVDHNPDLFDRAKERFASAVVVSNDRNRGLSGARNAGVAAARSDIVAFVDDDAEAAPFWLDRLTTPLTQPGVVGTGGKVAPAWSGGSPPSWFPDEFNWVVGCSYRGQPAEAGPVRNPIGASMAFSKSAIVAAGGFDSSLGRIDRTPLGGEETDLAIRTTALTGGAIWYVPSAAVRHHVGGERLTWSYFLRRCFAEGRSKALIAQRIGTAEATSAERRYTATLASGIVRRMLSALRMRRLSPLAQALAMMVGAGWALGGFVQESFRRRAVR